jgi:hypothetical protein
LLFSFAGSQPGVGTEVEVGSEIGVGHGAKVGVVAYLVKKGVHLYFTPVYYVRRYPS